MAISTYAELLTAIGTWTDNSVSSALYADFITLFEAKINRRLRVRQMETIATLTPSSGEATLPTDFLEWRRLTWTGDVRRELEYVSPSYLQAAYPDSPSDTPRLFTIEGSTIKIRPIDDTELELDYYAKIDPLEDGVNWLFSAHPDLYLWGALVELYGYRQDAAKAAAWNARVEASIEEIARIDQHYRGPMQIRAYGMPTP